jgi:hypothetical protein
MFIHRIVHLQTTLYLSDYMDASLSSIAQSVFILQFCLREIRCVYEHFLIVLLGLPHEAAPAEVLVPREPDSIGTSTQDEDGDDDADQP